MVAQISPPVSPAAPDTDRTLRAAAARAAALIDAGLVRRFNAGEETAFVEIVARYRAPLFQVAFRLLRNHADSEEVAQDALIRAHRYLGRFRGDCSLSAWLHRIALNLSYNRFWYFFRRQRQATLSLDATLGESSPMTFAERLTGGGPSPAHEMENNEFAAIVTRCMNRLSADQRDILSLRTVLHHSYEEISRTLGIEIGTVKSRIARARIRLRSLLASAYPEFGADASPVAWIGSARSAGGLEAISA